jgi:hypothetical protein
MATLSEALNTEREILNVYRTFLPRLRALIDQVKAIDPSASDASQRLDALDAQYLAFNREIRAALDPLDALARSQFDTLSEADKIAVNQSQVRRDTVQGSIQYSELREEFLAQSDIKFNQIERAASPPATPTIDNTAAPANAAPTSTNTLAGPASDDSGAQETVTTGSETPVTTDTTLPTVDGNNAEEVDTNAPDNSEREGEESTNDLGAPGEPPYENEGFKSVENEQNSRPGKRLNNPLSYLSSYTYQLSLYMISPDGYEAFIASGRKNIFAFSDLDPIQAATAADNRLDGVYLVAQSAGMGKPEYRANGFDLDYYIDNLSFEAIIAQKENDGPVANTAYRFKIVEPYGFSFVTKLRRAQEEIINKNNGRETVSYLSGSNNNPTKMFYILGIRFYGYDEEGNQVSGDSVFDGTSIDPNAGPGGALFETFYDIVITEFKFKIDGNATTYDIRAETASISSSINQTKGIVPDNKNVYGTTVRDMFSGPNGLLTQLNKDQKALLDNETIEHPITYRIQWLGSGGRNIALSRMNTPNKTSKSNQAGAGAENTAQSNEATAARAAPNKNRIEHKVSGGSPIVQELEQIIVQSTYLTDAMSVNYTDAPESDSESSTPESVEGAGRQIAWFSVSPQISNIRWDRKRKDWAYDITYVIQQYLIPQIENPYVVNNTSYYGPHKRYEYWYTGKNTEILGYEQVINNQYFVSLLTNPENSGNSGGNSSNNDGQGAKNAVNTQSNGNKSGGQGTPSLEAGNSFRTSLYDPESFAKAKIQILGDPDFLIHDTVSGTLGGGRNLQQAYSKFYEANGTTVNPTSGQVFVEIDFKEAVDYSRNGLFIDDLSELGIPPVEGAPGTLAINDSIEFWRYPEGWAERIRGVSYQVLTVTSTFQNGAFKQTINAVINPLAAKDAADKQTQEEEGLTNSNDNQTGNASPTTANTTTPTGTPTDREALDIAAASLFTRGPFADGYRLGPTS